MAKIDVMKIVGDLSGSALKFFDDAFAKYWLLYALIFIVILFVFIMLS